MNLRKNTDKPGFVRFLKDEKFIEWKLFQTEELSQYWEAFLEQHPDEKADFALAEKHFQNIHLSSYTLADEKKKAAMVRLDLALRRYEQKRRTRFIVYAAACVAVFILSVFFFRTDPGSPVEQGSASKNYVVGNVLESQDIQLISSDETTSFSENIDLEITESGIVALTSDKRIAQQRGVAMNSMNKLIVPYGKRSKITLADGTHLWLNSGSTVEFPSTFAQDKREISITGEVYIEVAENKKKPFYLHTSDFSVNVLGTKFNVSTYKETPQSVVLVEGSVALRTKKTQADYKLVPNEIAVLENSSNSFRKSKTDALRHISWIDGYIVMDNTPIHDALKTIERYYNLSFEFENNENVKNMTCNGKLFLSDNLDNVIKSVAIMLDMKYKKEGNKIYITDK